MIARTWTGAVRAADADAYLQYLHRTGFPEYAATPGNRPSPSLDSHGHATPIRTMARPSRIRKRDIRRNSI